MLCKPVCKLLMSRAGVAKPVPELLPPGAGLSDSVWAALVTGIWSASTIWESLRQRLIVLTILASWGFEPLGRTISVAFSDTLAKHWAVCRQKGWCRFKVRARPRCTHPCMLNWLTNWPWNTQRQNCWNLESMRSAKQMQYLEGLNAKLRSVNHWAENVRIGAFQTLWHNSRHLWLIYSM